MTPPSIRTRFFARHFPWILVAGLALVVIVITVMRGTGASTPDHDVVATEPQTSPAAVIPEGPRLRARLAPLEDPSLIADRREGQRKNIQATVDATQAALSNQFQSEKSDPAWAPSKERTLAELSTSDQIKDANADIRNLSVDCKTKVCRITGDFTNMSDGDTWVTLYMNHAAAEIPYASYKYVPSSDGVARIEVYAVARN